MASYTAYHPSISLPLVPHEFIYHCGHKVAGAADGLQDLYKRLVAHGLLVPSEDQVQLTHHCPACLKSAFYGAPGKRWGEKVRTATLALSASGEIGQAMSWLLMFKELWNFLTNREEHDYWRKPEDPVLMDFFSLWRLWCELSARARVAANAQKRFMDVIAELCGHHTAEDVAFLVDLYRHKPRVIESMMPSDCHERDNIYKECARRFRERAGAQDLAYPVDLAEEWGAVIQAASQWSSELLGPPQRHDMDDDLLAREDEEVKWGPEDHEHMVQVMVHLNDAAMRMKVKLHEMSEHQKPAQQIESEREMKRLTELLADLEARAQLARPLEREKRLFWRRYVRFAKPDSLGHFHGDRVVSSDETKQAPRIELFDGPTAEELERARLDGPFVETHFSGTDPEHGEKA
ncbi:hypothetical protein PG985_014826 [Apiospora marii]|uniref:Uncharacterized protein n=1 Tax=Apiospora marii TaxID=335849 RepID=A0ABR1RKF8_9PEZI